MSWIVYDPQDGVSLHNSEQEALAHLDHVLGMYACDDYWSEDVEGLIVAKVTHQMSKIVLGVRCEMTDDDWADLTGGMGDECDECWDYKITPVDGGDS